MSELTDNLSSWRYDENFPQEYIPLLAEAVKEIKVLEERVEMSRTCKTCGQDKIIAEIGAMFGYRADVMAVRLRKLEERLNVLSSAVDRIRYACSQEEEKAEIKRLLSFFDEESGRCKF